MAALAAAAPVSAAWSPVLSHPAHYRVVEHVTLTNLGAGMARDVTAEVIVSPPAQGYSRLTIRSITPRPVSRSRDVAGNTVARFVWGTLGPHRTATISITYTAESWVVRDPVPKRSPPYSSASPLVRQYTNPRYEAQRVDTGNPVLRALDNRVAPRSLPPAAQARLFFTWIVKHIDYNYHLKAAGSALNVLRTRSGICTDFADLMVGMLRTRGIPARLISGYVVNNGGDQPGFHQWVEFWLPNEGWVVADPTWGADGDFMALHDDWHIALSAGLSPDIRATWSYANGALAKPRVTIAYHYTFTRLPAGG
jgi:transglutaminase-like putative cysteine protease